MHEGEEGVIDEGGETSLLPSKGRKKVNDESKKLEHTEMQHFMKKIISIQLVEYNKNLYL